MAGREPHPASKVTMKSIRLLMRAPSRQMSSLLKWPLDPDTSTARSLKEIEAHWSHALNSAELSAKDASVESKYILAMFPYPSGNLHMGHLRVYCISDAVARYYALNGYRVTHPIGWDAFGLPAENAAIERGVDPKTWTYGNICTMREQLQKTGLKFDWDREISTCNPNYYRWTQWIFLQLYKRGLVRRTFSEVYWDPVDKTTLAAEQVDAQGLSWRSGAPAEKRKLYQWAIETPKYAKRLLKSLESMKPNWREAADIQANWIGKCDAYRFLLPVKSHRPSVHDETFDLRVFDPQQLLEGHFLVIRDGHPLSDSSSGTRASGTEQEGAILLDQTAYNFLTDSYMPIVLVKDGTSKMERDWLLDARIANPKRSDFDTHLSRLFQLETNDATAKREMSSENICEQAEVEGYGGYITSRSLLDWVVSRQRAWGTPIPMILDDEKRNSAPAEERDLPIHGDERGRRVTTSSLPSGYGFIETETLDTFFDSSWYYLRYLDPNNFKQLVDPHIASRDMPVSVYVGGIEHAALHLFFARFINHFLFDLGVVDVQEPFAKLITQGMVRGKTYLMPGSKTFIREEEVLESEGRLVQKSTGEEVTICYEKMSKSKFNGVDPLHVIDADGNDLAKLQLLAMAGPKEYLDWGEARDSVLKGLRRWIDRMARIVSKYVEARIMGQNNQVLHGPAPEFEESHRQQLNTYLRDATIALEVLSLHNTAIEKLQSLTNAMNKASVHEIANSEQFEKSVHALVIMVQVFAPNLAAELWAALSTVPKLRPERWKSNEPVWKQIWPEVDEDAEVEFVITLFGTTLRARAKRPTIETLGDDEVLSLAKEAFHKRLFDLLEENSIQIARTSVQRREGLHVTINLEFNEKVPSSKIYEILDSIGEEKKRAKRRLGIKA